MGFGQNKWKGTIDGDKIKILTSGYGSDGQLSYGLGSPEGEGEYPN